MRRLLALALFLGLFINPCASAQKDKKSKHATNGTAVIWHDPGDIRAKNLLLGPGGDDQPRLPIKFVKEDLEGHSPKFDTEDAAGEKWKAKLGAEAQTEPVASRLLWAVGYFANENYFFHDLQVQDMQALTRGQEFESAGGHVKDVRLQKHQL